MLANQMALRTASDQRNTNLGPHIFETNAALHNCTCITRVERGAIWFMCMLRLIRAIKMSGKIVNLTSIIAAIKPGGKIQILFNFFQKFYCIKHTILENIRSRSGRNR